MLQDIRSPKKNIRNDIISRKKEFPLKPPSSKIGRSRKDAIIEKLGPLMPKSRLQFWKKLGVNDKGDESTSAAESSSDKE